MHLFLSGTGVLLGNVNMAAAGPPECWGLKREVTFRRSGTDKYYQEARTVLNVSGTSKHWYIEKTGGGDEHLSEKKIVLE